MTVFFLTPEIIIIVTGIIGKRTCCLKPIATCRGALRMAFIKFLCASE